MKAVKLQDVLSEMDKRNAKGERLPFSITFYTHGSRVDRIALSKAVRCGLPKHLKGKDNLIGVRVPINSTHPYPVHQRLITEFNGQDVVY